MKQDPIHLYLLRHGNTFEPHETAVQVGARTDLPLTAQGIKQAHHFAAYITSTNVTLSALYAGGLKRQTETANILGEQLHLHYQQILHENALTELDYGDWEGLSPEKIAREWPKEYLGWTTKADWPSNIFVGSLENHLGAIHRWVEVLRTTYHSGESIVAVTSNGIIRLFYSLHEKKWLHLKEWGEMETLKVKTGHFCELLLFPNAIEINCWNAPTFEPLIAP